LLVGAMSFLATRYARRMLVAFAGLATAIFFVNYIYHFLSAIISYYLSIIPLMFSEFQWLIAYYFLVFFLSNLLFYFFGSLFFIYMSMKELK